MKMLWVIAVCACWLAVLVQQQQCVGFTNQLPIEKGVDVFNLHSEQKLHIAGFNGLCASVKNGDYHNGNAIVLSECKDREETQLWNIGKDQTIRSKGKCLTTYGYNPGNYVMIFDCRTAVPDATKWEFQSNLRRIINPKSELSLTARKDDNDGMYYLVLDFHRSVPRQVWLPIRNPKPPVVVIGGHNSLCVTLDGVQRVKLDMCDQKNKDAWWSIYPDGTIRPEQHQSRCLRFEYGQHRISVGECGGWTNEPWLTNRSNGTIFHLATGMVMDIKRVSVRPIRYSAFLNCYDGRDTQKWLMITQIVSDQTYIV